MTSAVFPLLGPTQVLPRLFSVAFAFFPVYLLLSLLYPFFCVLRQTLSKLKCDLVKVYAIHVLVSVSIIPVYYQVLKHQFHRVFFFSETDIMLISLTMPRQEGLFILCFCVVLFSWIQLEKEIHITKEKVNTQSCILYYKGTSIC